MITLPVSSPAIISKCKCDKKKIEACSLITITSSINSHSLTTTTLIPPFLPNLTDFDPQNSLTTDDLANLNKWGFNVIRFYAAWMGVYPHSSTEINYEYLMQLSKAVSMMENHGIYTLLDCHQDIFSRFFCGEGVPDWVAIFEGNQTLMTFPFPLALNITREPDTGYPILEECLRRSFGQYYLTEAVTNGFKMLYTNGNGTRESFASFWRTVANQFANRSSVLGYELHQQLSLTLLATQQKNLNI
ncbi:unnamed protein product [Rotaria sordida]|uniref:Glycoside hydrolase family 5 domain-containing protein n=1 Tax=Rotaria sordida TaxID=392033 RepID=A0A814NEZ1_9BILA|nr:unnamed protein product [Rotaria sordida]